jgi:hypothetical protein
MLSHRRTPRTEIKSFFASFFSKKEESSFSEEKEAKRLLFLGRFKGTWQAIGFCVALTSPLKLAAGEISATRGAALFRGNEALSGMIRGHDDKLPPSVVVCANCHEAATGLSAAKVPLISRALLLDMRQRRGGPPSRYDQASFCRMLRTGSDPATVLVAREMPVYDVGDDQCASLWHFLTSKDVR